MVARVAAAGAVRLVRLQTNICVIMTTFTRDWICSGKLGIRSTMVRIKSSIVHGGTRTFFYGNVGPPECIFIAPLAL